MPIKSFPSYKAIADKQFEIPQPGIGGLNLKDLEYEQEANQSPYMLNMMYRNGTFSKRYGMAQYDSYTDNIHATIYFAGQIIVHSGTTLYKTVNGTRSTIASNLPNVDGLFIRYAQILYYLVNEVFYQYKFDNDASSATYGTYVWSQVDFYVPDAFIGAEPDGSSSTNGDDFNALKNQFNITYNGDGTSTDYVAYGDEENIIDWTVTPTVKINDTITTAFTVDSANKKITFTTAPPEGAGNVIVTYTIKSTAFAVESKMIKNAKYYATFGNADNARLFLGGFGAYGKSIYYYSEAYDGSYFPIHNYSYIGNSEEDITGFGLQYNTLFVFKAKEIYSISAYTQTYATTSESDLVGTEAFQTQLVNSAMGCDAPHTIQLIDNRLTWFHSLHGICILVSTNIIDERNVRQIGRNIETRGTQGQLGILDRTDDLTTVRAYDFDNKYFIVFPTSGVCYVWDYEISPYYYTSSKETDAKKLSWFLFDNFYVKEFLQIDKKLTFICSKSGYQNKIIELNDNFVQLDFENGGTKGIDSFYMTPFLQFSAVEYLKTIKNIYVQCRGDTSSVIDMAYYTEESYDPEQGESIRIGGRIWTKMNWNDFEWLVVNHANTFRRKCSLKKIQMASFYFSNNVSERDMSISHIGLSYQIVKAVR